MNKLIGITAILTIAMFASGALADLTTTGTATGSASVICNLPTDCTGLGQYTCVGTSCVPITCGIDVWGSPAFGSITPGGAPVEVDGATDVQNTGNAIESPTILGGYWLGNTYILPSGPGPYMDIGATQWYSSALGGSFTGLTGSGASIGAISPSGIAGISYVLTVPSNTPTDSYTQIITFGAGC